MHHRPCDRLPPLYITLLGSYLDYFLPPVARAPTAEASRLIESLSQFWMCQNGGAAVANAMHVQLTTASVASQTQLATPPWSRQACAIQPSAFLAWSSPPPLDRRSALTCPSRSPPSPSRLTLRRQPSSCVSTL
eukprot:scaffold62234_cov32-Tisochrysis_lutea.AAC.3